MALPRAGVCSAVSFVTGFSNILLYILPYLITHAKSFIDSFILYLLLLHAAVVFGVLHLVYEDFQRKVAIRGGMLGVMFGIGWFITLSSVTWTHFGWYLIALSFFHWSEFMTTAAMNSRSLTLESYLIDHSREYYIAAVASWVEFFIEWYIFPGLKNLTYVSLVGLLLVAGGEFLRKLAMCTAGSNFNHYVQHVKEEGHQLVTHGIYQYFRHPSYVGWFYWSVGTQIILCNPICIVGYGYVSWRFFNERIEDEEVILLNFFGENYLDYQKRVSTGLPFIKGYRMEL